MGIPNHTTIASLVSNVTTTMLGRNTSVARDVRLSAHYFFRSAVLPIPGDIDIAIAISSSRDGCIDVGAALFSVANDDVDDDMISDTLQEMANMTAGQIKSSMGLDQALGLPRIVHAKLVGSADWKHFPVRAGKAEIIVSVTTKPAVVKEYL